MILEDKKTIGGRFKAFRKAINKTQKQLSSEINMSQANFAKIENGEIFPNLEVLIYLYKNYNLNIHWLVSGEGDIKRKISIMGKDYGEYTPDMEELLFYLDNNPRVRYAMLKLWLIWKYKNRDQLPINENQDKFELFEVADELSTKNRGDA